MGDCGASGVDWQWVWAGGGDRVQGGDVLAEIEVAPVNVDKDTD